MGKRKYDFTDEVAHRWCERYRRGETFTKIAASEGFERRLVTRTVRDFNRVEYLEEGAALRREIRTELFREHQQNMENAVWGLLKLTGRLSLWECCVIPPNETISFERPNTKSALVSKLKMMFLQSRKETVKSSADDIDDELKNHVFQREANTVVDDLKEHLPDLWGKVNVWEDEAAKYLEGWRILDEHATRKGIPSQLFAPGIQEAQRFLATSDENWNSPPAQDTFKTPEHVALWFIRNSALRAALMEIGGSHDRLKAAFTQLEDMLIPSEVKHSLLKRKCTHCPVP